MSDAAVVHIGENSPERVAYQLMLSIAAGENKRYQVHSGGLVLADKDWILSTYADCLGVVKGHGYLSKK